MFKLQKLEITGFKSFADYTEVIFTGDGITAVVGPNGCGKCVSGDTLITLSNGKEIQIKELVESALKDSFFREHFDDGFLTRENPQNVEILSLNPKTLKIEPRKVSAFIKRESTPKLLQIHTKAGREIKTTPYHPLFTLENGKLKTLKAEEVKKGVKIAVPRLLPTEKKNIEINYLNSFEKEDNVFLPYSEKLKNWSDNGRDSFETLSNWSKMADVSIDSLRRLRLKKSINIAEIKDLEGVLHIDAPFEYQIKSRQTGFINLPKTFSPELARFLGLLIAEGRNTSSYQVWFVNSDNQINKEFARLSKQIFGVDVYQKQYKKEAIDSLIFSQSLCKTLEKVFNFPINSNSFEKEIPAQIFEANKEIKLAFLSGLFEGDAYICSRNQKNNGKLLSYIEYATASEKLAKQVISLLLQLGVFAYLRPKQKYASNTTDKTVRQYYSVLIYGSSQLKMLAEKLSFVGNKQLSLKKLQGLNLNENPNRDLVPTANELVREAVKLANIKVKPNRKPYPKIAAYTGRICEPSRKGLNEITEQISFLSENIEPAEKVLKEISILADSDVFWDEIVEVNEIEPTEKYVYDLSIDETHNFIAENIIVHNSNISESIAWVLGEQRAKTLRGAEMKDVIFQGTSKRKPSGMAEVVLHLIREDVPYHDEEELSDIDESLSELDEHAIHAEDFEETETEVVEINETSENTGLATATAKVKTKRHWRPRNRAFDFAVGEAVSVTRRIYLSGESDYLLNGKNCRLRDIHDLFSGTGLSGTNYAIIEQGRIGQILSSKPSDRRNLIEEAAGISKFRTRQRAAETRLESAKGNLRRISDIVSEIDKQANSLRRQAAKTKRYKILREEFRELLKNVFTAEGKFLSDLVGELETKLANAVETERNLLVEVTAKDEAFRSSTQFAREAEENLAEIRQIHSENALQRDRLERDLVYKNEQIANVNNRLEVLKGEVSDTENRLKLVKSEVERLQKDEKISSSEFEKEELAFRQIERSYQDKLNEVREIESELEKERGELTAHTAAVERFAEIERQLENTIERLTERIEGLRREGERAETSYSEHLRESEILTKTIVEAKENLAKLLEEKNLLATNASKTRETLRESEKNLAKIREDFSRTKHRLETLQELEEKRAIYAPSVQKLFAEEAKIGVKFLGTLADKLNVDSKAEKAVEAIFGNYLQTVLVATENDAKKVAKYLSENNLGRISILSIESKKTKVKRQKNSLLDSLGVDDDFASTLIEVFPREMSAQIVESIDDIDLKSADNFVTFDGDLCFGGKLFVSGKANSNEKNTSLLAFKRELRELSAKYETLSKEIEISTNDVEKLRLILSEKETQIADKQQVISKAEKDLLSNEIQAKSLAQETERAERHRKVVANETTQIEQELGEIRNKQIEANANAKKAFSAKDSASETLANITKKLTDARIKIEAESSILSEKRALAATTAERRRSAQNALRRIENEQTELENRLARQTFEIKENEGKLDALTSAIAEITRKTESAESDQELEQNELNEATENLKLSRERADAMSTELAELNQKSGEARNSRAELEVQQAETVTRLQNLNENCFQELNQTLIELVESNEIEADFALETEKKRVEDLRKRLEDFGAVNMLALEELAEAEERLLFLTSQRQDIIDSINSAEEALREIKRRSRERFREAFSAINEYFTEFFFELFGGGRGEMSLIEAEDILESGIEIVAQPPGKRLQNILLLSGGEKAMTAIALVMAIFKYRPSPFCLLDEVDAPLDDANVGRFVDKIAQMSENTQFIVITHNKRTMEAAKALYGVTMEEAGVSKVVSVRFE